MPLMTDTPIEDFPTALRALAEESGAAEAMLAPGRAPLRFADLFRSVTETCATLNRIGVGRGDRVAAALPRGPEAAVCFFGVAAGATYVPLNPDYTEDEFDRYLARIRPQAVIVPFDGGAAIRSAAERLGIPVLELVPGKSGPAGTFEIRGREIGVCAKPGWASAEDIALILLTSGTTARPKLVPNKHRHLLALVRAGRAHLRLERSDRYLHSMPMFHGHGLKSGLVLPVLAGSTVIVAPEFDVPTFFEAMATFHPTWYTASYTIHQAILDRVHEYEGVARDARLRFITSGSGKIEIKVIRGLEAAFGAPFLDRYSMSETGVLTCDPLPPGMRKPGSVGKALLSEVRIADEGGNFLDGDQEGEILVRGPSMFEGYLDDPEATAKAFVNGWFRTGDLGRLDGDGYLTICGRIKEMINRGGEKIGPAEVERVIAEHPGVARVCVFGIPHPTLGQEVAAAVVPVEGALVSESSIVEFARARLAAFKVPRCVAFTSEFPQTPSRKIDRRALAEAYGASLARAEPVQGPTAGAPSPVEAAVAELWQKLLRQDHVRMDADFFLAGGDSLKAAELFAAIRQRFGVHLNLREIFGDGATARGLALLVERAQDTQRGLRDLPERIMPINRGAERIALFGIPGSDGYPGSFLHLGRLIDSDQPFYGLESRGLDGAHSPLDRIEDIAADHLRAIRQLQPAGPYLLLGACFGGRVAYEMARQLESAGEQVGMLAMLDPSPPFTDSEGQPRDQPPIPTIPHDWTHLARFVGGRIRLYANEVSKLDGRQRITYLRSKLHLVREMVQQKDLFRGDRREMQTVAVYEANLRAGRRYVPGPYRGPAIFAMTDGRVLKGARNYRFDWLELIPQAESPQYVPGRDTGDMLIPPNVYALARRVNAWVREAQERAGAPGQALPRRSVSSVAALG